MRKFRSNPPENRRKGCPNLSDSLFVFCLRIVYSKRLVSVSGKITHGRNCLASSKSISA